MQEWSVRVRKLTHLQPRPKRPEPPPLEDETPRLLCAEDQKLPVPLQVRKILKFGNPQAYVRLCTLADHQMMAMDAHVVPPARVV